MAASAAAARTELFGLLASDTDGTPKTALAAAGVERIHQYDPITHAHRMCIGIVLEEITPDDFRFVVRIYRGLKNSDIDVDTAQADIDVAVLALDAAIHASPHFGPSAFQVIADRDLGAFIVETRVDCPREDGYYS